MHSIGIIGQYKNKVLKLHQSIKNVGQYIYTLFKYKRYVQEAVIYKLFLREGDQFSTQIGKQKRNTKLPSCKQKGTNVFLHTKERK